MRFLHVFQELERAFFRMAVSALRRVEFLPRSVVFRLFGMPPKKTGPFRPRRLPALRCSLFVLAV
jgi:hypothetical protein